MDTLTYKTISAKNETVEKSWFVLNAEGKVLGRIASEVAKVIRGKHKASFTPHVDCGDNVIIINAEKIRLTGDKMNVKEYVRHTGYPGGQRKVTPKVLLTKKPEKVVEMAVRGMLPRNRLGRQVFKNLHVYAGSEHPHEAQNPKVLEFK